VDKDQKPEPYQSLLEALGLAPKRPSTLLDTLFGIGPAPLPPAAPTMPRPSLPSSRTRSTAIARTLVGVPVASQIVRSLLAKKAPDVNVGRVLPSIDDLAVGEGRKLNAAFVYTDLHGFTKLVASLPTTTSFSLMQVFVELIWRITRHFGGTLVDCAGDRVLSVFYRPALDFGPEPVREAITAALWSQVIVQRAIAPEFTRKGVPDTSVAIGVDYGPATIGCIGIRNNKRLVFFGDAANRAAKLQDNAGPNDTALSAAAYAHRPSFLNNWPIQYERDSGGNERYRIAVTFQHDEPPARAVYLK